MKSFCYQRGEELMIYKMIMNVRPDILYVTFSVYIDRIVFYL